MTAPTASGSNSTASSATTPCILVLRQPGLDGVQNMRRDAALLAQPPQQELGVLRFYTWARPTISLGHMQRAADLLDLEACQRDGVDVAQRPTGGRAILHEEEVTYSFTGRTDRPPFDAGLQEVHRIIAECLQEGLALLGVTVSLSRPTADPQRRLIRQPCFTSAGRAEILVDNRKLLGSAQRRSRDAFLQHGSLLLGPAHTRIVDYMRDLRPQASAADDLRRRLLEGTTHLGALLDPLPSFDGVCDALQEGFARRLQATCVAARDTPAKAATQSGAA